MIEGEKERDERKKGQKMSGPKENRKIIWFKSGLLANRFREMVDQSDQFKILGLRDLKKNLCENHHTSRNIYIESSTIKI